MEYRCVTTSIAGFVQQLAVAYITHGYWFYVAGEIPEGKDPAAVDAKLIDRYGIAISKWARCRRKKQGLANMQYLRHVRFFLLLATKGRHEFFDRERESFRDVRRAPINFAGYSIGCRRGLDGRWHASVRIAMTEYAAIKAAFEIAAFRRKSAGLERGLADLRYLSFSPVVRQVRDALMPLNRRRRAAGLQLVQSEAVLRKRRVSRPFDREEHESGE